MVITTGDNYVGAAEPQLREKMTAIFQRIENNFGKPTPTELSNVSLISGQFGEAKTNFEAIKRKYRLANAVSLMSYQDFIKSN